MSETDHQLLNALTPRQVEVLSYMAKGLSNPEIAGLTGISPHTVKLHVAAVLRGLQVSNRTEAAFLYRQILDSEQPAPQVATMENHGRPTVAVLPFGIAPNLMSANEQQWVSFGLTEEVIACLSRWRWFPVLSSLSTRQFDQVAAPLTEIKQKLGAKYVLSGQIMGQGGDTRIHVELADVDTQQSLFADSYEFDTSMLLESQHQIGNRIAAAIAPTLINPVAIDASQAIDVAYSTWQLSVRGLSLIETRKEAFVQRGLAAFEQALAQDDQYAMAWYGYGRTQQIMLYNQFADDRSACLQAMGDASDHCMALAPTSGHSHVLHGMHRLYSLDLAGAEAAFRASIGHNPSLEAGYGMLAQCEGLAGRPDDCIAMVEEALLLNPIGEGSARAKGVIGMSHYVADRAAEAAAWLDQAITLNPDAHSERLTLAAAYVELEELEQARAHIETLHQRHSSFSFAEHLKNYAPIAKPELVEKQREALAKVGYSP